MLDLRHWREWIASEPGFDREDRRAPLHQQLAACIEQQIALGYLPVGATLPSVRVLAPLAKVSRVTASQAIDVLVERGWAARRNRAQPIVVAPTSTRQRLAPADVADMDCGDRDFRVARVSAPIEAFMKAALETRVRMPVELMGGGRIPGGHAELRVLIAEKFTRTGLPTSPEDIIVTNGAMGAFSALLDVLPGSILLEEPTYHTAISIARAKHRRLVPWRRTTHWDIPHLTTLLGKAKPAVAFLVPDFHNPTGLLASTTERNVLMKVMAADSNMRAVVVDETFIDLDLRAEPREQIMHVATARHGGDKVITIGGLSKTVWSGMRIGWARVADPDLRASIQHIADVQPPPIFDQLVAVDLWPKLDSIVTERVSRLRAQRDAALTNIEERGLRAAPASGGLSLWVDLGSPIAEELRMELARSGWLISTGANYSPSVAFSPGSGLDRFIRVPFTHDVATINRFFNVLGPVLASLRAVNRP